MLKKGFELSYVFLLFLALFFVVVMIAYMKNIYMHAKVPKEEPIVDVRYACVNYDEESVDKEIFQTLLYGVLTGQCESLQVELTQTLTIEELENIVGKHAIKLEECKLPSVNTGSLYVVCEETISGWVSIVGRGIKNSDVLICCES